MPLLTDQPLEERSQRRDERRAELQARLRHRAVRWRLELGHGARHRHALHSHDRQTNYDGKPSGSAAKFKYDPKGAPARDSLDLPQRLSARNLYIPYSDGGTSSNGFADLTPATSGTRISPARCPTTCHPWRVSTTPPSGRT
ncbi:hypothetical protein GmRootV512_62950 [Variovorax sp. V512]